MSVFKLATAFLLVVWLFACGGSGGSGESSDRTVEAVQIGVNFTGGLAVAPDGRIFYSELTTGKIRIATSQELFIPPVAELPVLGTGNEGLTGLAIDPEFPAQPYLYAYYTASSTGSNQVVRLTLSGNQAVSSKVLLSGIPAGGHNGGALAFDNQRRLYIGTGDAGQPALAQNDQSLAGKILRINADGSIPAANPLAGSPILAKGFRNVFGLAVKGSGNLIIATDNGPDCDDEINIIESGKNYGWRADQGCGDTSAAYTQPAVRLNPSVAPTGVVISGADIYVGDFISGGLIRYTQSAVNQLKQQETVVAGEYGPVISLASGPGNRLYFSTNNAVYTY